jgi:hypothetical protein
MTMIDTPEGIAAYRFLALRSALKLEVKGLKRRGCSAYSILKREYGYKGDKKKVLEQVERDAKEIVAGRRGVPDVRR